MSNFLDALLAGNSVATALATLGLPVAVDAASPPTAGQVLTALDGQRAAWATPATSGGGATAGAGLTQSGTTIAIGAPVDGSIIVDTHSPRVGVLPVTRVLAALVGQRVSQLLDPVDPQDAATRGWVQALVGSGGGTLTASAIVAALATLATDIGINGQKLTGVATPAASTDAATKGYVDSAVAAASVTFAAVQTALAAASSAIDFHAQRLTGVATPTASTDAASKGYVDSAVAAASVTFAAVQTALAGATAAVGFNSQKLTGVATPTTGTDAANKTYVDSAVAAAAVTFAAVQTALAAATSAVGFNSQRLTGVATPTASTDAANKSYVDAGDNATYAAVNFARLQALFAIGTSAIAFNSQRLTTLADPTSAQDAATKNYVDALVQGLDVKTSCRAATTANVGTGGGGTITSAPNVVDGVTLAVNDRVLVKSQTTGSQNGVYAVTTVGTGSNGTWTRSSDANTSAKVTAGMFVFVAEGTVNADTGWVLSTDDAITLDTTALTFTQFSSAGVITAGNGLSKSGQALSVLASDASISVSGSGVTLGTLAFAKVQTALAAATAALTFNSQKLSSVADPTSAQDAATKAYVDAIVTFARITTALAAATAAVSFNGQLLSSIADPVSAQDAATKNYVDGHDVITCKYVATANIALTGNVAIGTATTTTGDLVLAAGQSSANNNGLWIANSAGAWTRPTWANTPAKVNAIPAYVGRAPNGQTGLWIQRNPIATIGSDSIVLDQALLSYSSDALSFGATSVNFSCPVGVAAVVSATGFSGPLTGNVSATSVSAAVFAETPSAATLSSGAATLDLSTANDFEITLNAATVALTLTNLARGRQGTIAVIQDATGSRGSTFTFTTTGWTQKRDGSYPDLLPAPTANAITLYTYACNTLNGTNYITFTKTLPV